MLSGGNFHHWARYAVLFFFFGEVNVGGLTQKKLEQLFCSQLWPDHYKLIICGQAVFPLLITAHETKNDQVSLIEN